MGDSTTVFDQLTPLPQSLDGFYRARHSIQEEMRGKAYPASVTEIDATGTIVKVKFEVLEPGTNDAMKDLHPKWIIQWPETEMPVATDLYAIAPLQVGAKGYCIPAEADLGAVTGYFDGPASLTTMPNLSTLVFHPLGSVQASARQDPQKYFLSGPTGVQIVDLSGIVCINIGPVEDGIGNAIQILASPAEKIAGLLNCSSDAQARGQGVPQYGLYHNNGTVRYQYTVP